MRSVSRTSCVKIPRGRMAMRSPRAFAHAAAASAAPALASSTPERVRSASARSSVPPVGRKSSSLSSAGPQRNSGVCSSSSLKKADIVALPSGGGGRIKSRALRGNPRTATREAARRARGGWRLACADLVCPCSAPAVIVARVGDNTAAVMGSSRAEAARVGLFSGPAERSEKIARFSEDRFLTRARALFYARLAFLVLGLGIIAVPAWSQAFGVGGPKAYAVYLIMVAYSAANYLLLPLKRIGKALTFITLCADLGVLVALVSETGGLRSHFLAAQLLFTTLFVVLFPTPLAVVPPLLTFPVVAKLDQLLGGRALAQIDIFILLWYSALNCILMYVVIYLNERDRT